jgi:hypothetical protein
MTDTQTVSIVCIRHGHGFVCFFDEPFGDQTPFELAGGYSVFFDSGRTSGGALSPEDLALGLDGWLTKMGWHRKDEATTTLKTPCVGEGWGV